MQAADHPILTQDCQRISTDSNLMACVLLKLPLRFYVKASRSVLPARFKD